MTTYCLNERSRAVAGQMAKGVEFLFRKNKVDYFVGTGHVNAPGMVSITQGEHKGKFFKTKNIMVATGCKMRRVPGLEFDGVRVMTSREALVSKEFPKSIAIVGAGAIGVEFAYFYNAFGSKVTLVEMLPQILPVEDDEVSRTLQRSFEKQGIVMHTGTKCENFRVGKGSVKVDLVCGDGGVIPGCIWCAGGVRPGFIPRTAMTKTKRAETEAEHQERMKELQKGMRAAMREAKERRGG